MAHGPDMVCLTDELLLPKLISAAKRVLSQAVLHVARGKSSVMRHVLCAEGARRRK